MKTLVEKYAFDTTQNPPVYCEHSFCEISGNLVHTVQGQQRAAVTGPNVVDYLTSKNVSHVLTTEELAVVAGEFLVAQND